MAFAFAYYSLSRRFIASFFYHLLFQTHEKPPELDNCPFDSFDQVDDVQRLCDDDDVINTDMIHALDPAARDLLNRLMEKNPQHRLKSILALQRIAYFHNFNFDDVRHRKVRNDFDLQINVINFSFCVCV